MHPFFVGVAQKVNRAKRIDKKRAFERMLFLLAAILQLSVDFVARTINGTFYAVMDKKGGVSVEGGGSSCDGSSYDGPSCNSAPVRWQCAQERDSAAPAHSSALHAKDALICLRLIGSCV